MHQIRQHDPTQLDQTLLERKPPPIVSTGTITCTDPATLTTLGEVPVYAEEEVKAAVDAARQAQKYWRKTSFAERKKILSTVLEHVLEHADELCDLIAQDVGKTRENAMLGEIWTVCEKLRYTLAHGERYLRPERVSSGILFHKKAQVVYDPLGVIGVIAPWNYPLQNVMGPVIPALFSGNAVVVKVSEWSSWSAKRIQRIFDEAFTIHGYPIELVTLITGYAETGAALCRAGVDKLIFTGSMTHGREVMAQCAETLTPMILELGGNDAMIICDDADLEQAVHAALNGVFLAAGQNCLAAERIFVFDRIYDAFVQRIHEQVKVLRQGPPLGKDIVDVGAITSPAQLEVIQRLVDDAVDKGAKILAGGQRNPKHFGQFFEPTILTDVRSDMAIMQEETFGPVMVLVRVHNEAEAVRYANDTSYGLSSSVFSRDRKRAERITQQLITGSTCINDFGMTYMAQELPFGGLKGSGFGRLNGREGLRACTTQKAVLSDRSSLHKPARVFPVGPQDYELSKAFIRMVYSKGIRPKVAAFWDLLRLWRNKG